MDLQGVLVKVGDCSQCKGSCTEIPREHGDLIKSNPPPRKSPEKWTFLSLTVYNTTSLHNVERRSNPLRLRTSVGLSIQETCWLMFGWEKKLPINLKNFGGRSPLLKCNHPGEVSHLSRRSVPVVPRMLCPIYTELHMNQAKTSRMCRDSPPSRPQDTSEAYRPPNSFVSNGIFMLRRSNRSAPLCLKHLKKEIHDCKRERKLPAFPRIPFAELKHLKSEMHAWKMRLSFVDGSSVGPSGQLLTGHKLAKRDWHEF